jgi:hypothetical protein
MHEAPAEYNEHREHAEHAAHSGDPFAGRVSITIALLAVVTALVGSLETIEAAAAITESSRAVLAQDQATDSWSFYQNKSIKKRLDAMAAEQGGPHAAQYAAAAKREADEEVTIQGQARTDEKSRDEYLNESAHHEQRHHRLAAGATLLEMAIAIATIAIITRKRWPWLASVGLGAVGAAVAIWGMAAA